MERQPLMRYKYDLPTQGELLNVKRIGCYLPLLSLLLFCVPFASAQSSVDFMVGFGGAHDSAASTGLDSEALTSCSPVGGTDTSTGGTCEATGALNGFFLGFGGDVMLWKHLGIGAEVSFQPERNNFVSTSFGNIQSRVTFYDFNAIYAPVNSKRASLYLEGGIGGARTGLSINESSCVGSACTGSVEPVASSNHFAIHGAIGVSLFVTEHIFIRPQFDVHYVPNFTTQPGFNSNFVPAGMVWLGYNFGER
jgi:opacity protein-like surface antigen